PQSLVCLPCLPSLVQQRQVLDDLVNAALDEANGKGYVLSTQAVTERPSLYLSIAVDRAVGDLVVHRSQLAHGLSLDIDRDVMNWIVGLEILIRENLVARRCIWHD